MSQGTCFGYAIRSSMAFSFLREGDGTRLDVLEDDGAALSPTAEPLLEWKARDSTVPRAARLYADGRMYRLRVDGLGSFGVDPDAPSVTMATSGAAHRQEAAVLGIPLALCFSRRGDLPLHAAAVEVDGGAVLLGAPGGAGKTTLAGAFLRAGYRVLSEDLSCCRTGSPPTLLPGPALLRVRRDVYRHLTWEGTQLLGEDRERVYVAIARDRRGGALPVPIRAIVLLREGADGVRLERVTSAASIPDLWALSLRLPLDDDRIRCFNGVTGLAAAVPVWNLHRRRDFASLPEVVEAIVSRCR